jgi:hypothetical protein
LVSLESPHCPRDQGKDWEDEIDKEMQEEDADDTFVKQEVASPGIRPKQKRVRIVKKLVERPKTVYERFPAFEKDKILDFSELFKGYTVRKSRLVKRPFHGETVILYSPIDQHVNVLVVETVYPRKREVHKGFLDAVVGDTKRQVESKRVEDVVSSGSIEFDLRQALEVRRSHSFMGSHVNVHCNNVGAGQHGSPPQYIIARSYFRPCALVKLGRPNHYGPSPNRSAASSSRA